MTTAELITLVRQIIDDTVEPYLLTDEQIRTALANAEKEFALATLSNFKRSSVSITAGSPWADIPTDFIFVRSVLLDNTQLRVVTTHEMDYGFFDLGPGEDAVRWSQWREGEGTPKFAITDMGPDQLRLVPIPAADETLEVEGFGVPVSLDLAGSPMIPSTFHEALRLGAVHRIYAMQDTEIGNQERAVQYLNLWMQEIGLARQTLQSEKRAQSRMMSLPRGFEFGLSPGVTAGPENQNG